MATKGTALRPEVFNLPSFKPKEQDEEILTEEEQILAQGAGQKFWKTLKSHVDKCIEELDQINEEAIGDGSNLEEIGRNTVVINLTKGVIRRIFNKVEDSRQALEEKSGK